jgi:hypothetical protein
MKAVQIFALLFVCLFIPSALFWFFWTYLEYGVFYFNFLPVQFHSIPLTDCFVLMLLLSFLCKLLMGKEIVEIKR